MALSLACTLMLTAGSQVPAPLATLERVAEDIDDAVVAGDWTKVERLEVEGRRAVHRLETDGAASHRAAEALDRARAATRARDALGTRVAANTLADAVVDLFEPLKPSVPISVMRLDVLLRTVDLAAIAARPGEARVAIDRVWAIWNGLAAKAPVAGSPVEGSFNTQLAAIERTAKDNDFLALHSAAAAALDGVDELEARFTTRNP